MRTIYTTEVYCDKCKRNVPVVVWSDDMKELPASEKERAKEFSLYWHKEDTHLNCLKCKKHIIPEEIEDLIWNKDEQEWALLCKDCAK